MEYLILVSLLAMAAYFINKLSQRVNALRAELSAAYAALKVARSEVGLSVTTIQQLNRDLRMAHTEIDTLLAQIERLKPFVEIADLDAELRALKSKLDAEAVQANNTLSLELIGRRQKADGEVATFIAAAQARLIKIEAAIKEAGLIAKKIIDDANKRAEDIAGDAYKALQNVDSMKKVADAMRNRIDGYGDRYIIPTYTLLDDLSESYGFDVAGADLKRARVVTKRMVEESRAAICEYVEANRAATAVRFVLDAFDGKVDSIVGRLKADNYGTLRQQVVDAFALVNYNGQAFRNAKITEEYLNARLEELKLGCLVAALRDRDREEQRQIRERIREEERAQRDFERAMKEAQRDEEIARKAVEKLEAQLKSATDSQRVFFEEKLQDMQRKLVEAEAKGQRALSMAQQTKAGHVYIISNIGSFGKQVFKIGMTRRLEPLDRIAELGDASVPFPFDVHGMIYSEDAPKLEHKLHQQFLINQVNKVNPRKEFFRLGLEPIRNAVEALGIEAHWTLQAVAAQYHESIAIEATIAADAAKRHEWEQAQLKIEAAEFDDVAEGVR